MHIKRTYYCFRLTNANAHHVTLTVRTGSRCYSNCFGFIVSLMYLVWIHRAHPSVTDALQKMQRMQADLWRQLIPTQTIMFVTKSTLLVLQFYIPTVSGGLKCKNTCTSRRVYPKRPALFPGNPVHGWNGMQTSNKQTSVSLVETQRCYWTSHIPCNSLWK